jgi:glutaredoxin-dependent peroxiredoxin
LKLEEFVIALTSTYSQNIDQMKIEVGQPAPDFSLYASDKNKVTLSELEGQNILVLFYPVAFTGTCTKELCSIRDNISKYDGVKAKVLAISVDTVYSLVKYKQEQQLNFPLLSDFNKEASIAYDVLYATFSYGMKGVSKRSAFVIDKNGIIQYAEVLAKRPIFPTSKPSKKPWRG